ncbi:MAG TPA: gliding motility-associated C-terminal domain-containing protein, partial [Bacteroidia bacterium]|nr:gliding motility-associated C-terminal domain-containing protein [Bacteroidia bacterium]
VEIDNSNDDFSGVAPDVFGDNVLFTGDVESLSSCVFGNITAYGNGEEWSFMAKWTCACDIALAIRKSDTVCTGGAIILSAPGGGTSYKWSPSTGLNSDTVSNPIATPSLTTNYVVTISDGTCAVKDTTKVIVRPGPIVTICCDSIIKYGQGIQLSSSGGANYMWTPANGLSCDNCPNPIADPTQSITYYVTVLTDSGCSITQSITVDVVCGTVFVPEAFSPNGDGQNDHLYVRGDCIKELDFIVFDRWGNKVFETDDKNIPWDGTSKGQAMNTGSYVYSLSATLYDGTNIQKKGNVALVR